MAGIGTIVALVKAMAPKADPAVIEQAVSDWLDDHPEATTTVEDGAITYAKLDSEMKAAADAAYKTPFQLGLAADKGYITGTTTFGLNRSLTTARALFAWLPCGKGTTITVDGSVISGFEIRKYSLQTGEYIESQGAVNTNKTPITVSHECVICIYASTSYTDVAEHYDTINAAIKISLAKPSDVFEDYPCNFEYGQLDTSTGKVGSNSTNRLRSKEYILVGAGTRILIPNTDAQLNILTYGADEAKGYIGAIGAKTNPVITIQQDSYIKLYASVWKNQEFSSESEVKPRYKYNEPAPTTLPPYYFTENYIYTKRSNVLSHFDDCAYNGMMFYFITDVHWDTNSHRSPALLKYMKEITEIKDLVFNGDGITNYDSKESAIINYNTFRRSFAEWEGTHWMPVVGNHELNNPGATAGSTAQLTPSEAYGMVTKENERLIKRLDEYSYYIDFEAVKVRMIFVGCKYDSQIATVTQTAVVGAIETTPQDYKILVCSHIGLTGKGSTGDIDTTLQPIVDALDIVHEKVIAVLTGHRHADGAVTTDAGVLIVATTCDGLAEGGSLTRTRGTITESAFEVVQIDLENDKMYLTRIGAGSNRTFNICQ